MVKSKLRFLTNTVKEFVLGSRVKSTFTEPVKLETKIMRSVYPDSWDPSSMHGYNEWTSEYRVSTIYHIKQTNNVACRW